MLLVTSKVTMLLVPLKSFHEELCIVEHFVVFKSLEQKLLNLEWFFLLKIISIFYFNFFNQSIRFHHIGPFGWLSHPKSQHLGPMTLEFTLGSIKGVIHTCFTLGPIKDPIHTCFTLGPTKGPMHICFTLWWIKLESFLPIDDFSSYGYFVCLLTSHGKMHKEYPIGHPICLFISSPFTLVVFLKALKRFFEKLYLLKSLGWSYLGQWHKGPLIFLAIKCPPNILDEILLNVWQFCNEISSILWCEFWMKK